MSVVYHDAYLRKFCDSAVEQRAYAEIDLLPNTYTEEWRKRLVVPMAYIIVCQDNQADPEDLFTAKLKTYKQEFERVLANARVATPDADGNILPVVGIPLERG